MSQQEYLGHTAIEHLRARLKDLQIKRIFLVRGNRSYVLCGAEAILSPIFQELRIEIVEFKDFSTNPKMEEAKLGLEQFQESGADGILAVGGGSVMDMAKLIRYYAVEQSMNVPLLAIPTTAGTGAEATHFAVVYVDGKKQSIEAEDILPDMAFVYPPFTYKNDAYLTACTGFDALAQACEAYWNRFATEESDRYALRAIALLHHQLPQCLENPTDQLRDDIAIGAYWAGRSINITKTTAPHAFSYAFTSKCGYPHGHAVALTFPFFAELNMKENPKRETFCKTLGLSTDCSLQEYFKEYANNIGLTYHGVGEYNLNDILHEVNLQRLANNPVMLEEKHFHQIAQFINSLI